ncbi:PLP-dependent cysteine synthase family protein [Acidipila sp. EB88]|uniref:PLP-dependent cysteine synthase family protein n=1 Tax=Acidipila sp. EB88 TaxID=2305226 RepID=UPI000F5EEBAB|nr:cysteine synthase family protein [Acidipila sp. EB88]RRA49028.1 cysteine synthase family protein [Acidipila sp. EB88]
MAAQIRAAAFTHQTAERLDALSHLVGDTPLMAIDYTWHGAPRTIYVKCENLNFTGSIKDRMALNILREAYASGCLHEGDTIAEATSGNTGISFAALGRALGHPVSIFMPDWMSQERHKLIQGFGAEIKPISRAQGGFLGSIDCCEQLAASRSDVFLPQQFSNAANCRAHRLGTGPELLKQLHSAGLRPDAFVAGVGTGGTVMGTGSYLQEQEPGIKVYAVEPAESPTLSTGHKIGSHRIQGISDDFIPAIMDLTRIHEILGISDGDSILMAQRLANELGLGVGISSGCNFLAAVAVQNRLGGAAVVATVFCDDNKKYLSTMLLNEEPVLDHYLSPAVQLTTIRSFCRASQLH